MTSNNITTGGATALAVYEPDKPHALVPANINEALSLSQELSKSSLIDAAYRAKSADVFHIVMAGAELGVPPLASLRLFWIDKGMPKLTSDGAVGVVLSHPQCEYFRLVESTNAIATYATKRRGDPEVRLSYTIQQAQEAQLLGKPAWKADRAAMLRARAKHKLAHAVYPDVLAGVAVGDQGEDDDSPMVAPPPPTLAAAATVAETKAERRRAAAAEKAAKPAPAAPPPSSDVIDVEYTETPVAVPPETPPDAAASPVAAAPASDAPTEPESEDFGADDAAPELSPEDKIRAELEKFRAQVEAVPAGPAAKLDLEKVRAAWLEWSKRPEVKALGLHKTMGEIYSARKAVIL